MECREERENELVGGRAFFFLGLERKRCCERKDWLVAVFGRWLGLNLVIGFFFWLLLLLSLDQEKIWGNAKSLWSLFL